MLSITNRFRRSLAMRGLRGTVGMCCYAVYSNLLPRYRAREEQRRSADEEFDRIHGVDTSGIVRPDPGEVVGNHWQYGVTYQAVDAGEFTRAIDGLSIAHEEFALVDYGSGKGRALLLASQLPFKRVTGVEYSGPLTQIARQNLKRYKGPMLCKHVEVIHADAADYMPGDDPLVLFFFNPFGELVMDRVVTNTVSCFRNRPRPIHVVYFTPYFAHLWESTGLFSRTGTDPAVLSTNKLNANLFIRPAPKPTATKALA